jgi:hypothetical protein
LLLLVQKRLQLSRTSLSFQRLLLLLLLHILCHHLFLVLGKWLLHLVNLQRPQLLLWLTPLLLPPRQWCWR